jgi:glutathione peroxidase
VRFFCRLVTVSQHVVKIAYSNCKKFYYLTYKIIRRKNMKTKILTLTLGLFIMFNFSSNASASTESPTENMSEISAYNFQFKTADGKNINLEDYRGKVLLVVNTASQCGFTPQYEGMQKIYDDYKDKGFVVIAVPSNDFKQETGSNDEIKHFCTGKYNITFPIAEKQAVTGDEAAPFYKWAAKEVGVLGSPKWNFHKYLISKNGKIVDWFSSPTRPESDKIRKAIEKELK